MSVQMNLVDQYLAFTPCYWIWQSETGAWCARSYDCGGYFATQKDALRWVRERSLHAFIVPARCPPCLSGDGEVKEHAVAASSVPGDTHTEGRR